MSQTILDFRKPLFISQLDWEVFFVNLNDFRGIDLIQISLLGASSHDLQYADLYPAEGIQSIILNLIW